MPSSFPSLLLTTVLSGSALMACAQEVVNYHAFALRPGATSRTVIYYGASKQAVLRALGKPTKTTRFYYEIDRLWATVLHYGPNQLFFANGKLDIAELHDNRWTIGQLGGFTFRVGSALSRPPGKAPVFGKFQVEDKPGKSRNFTYSAISYGAFGDGHYVADDDGYEILFDKQGRVTHVFFGNH